MAEFTGDKKIVDRRGFLKGSALFAAAALGVAAHVAPAFAQDPAPQTKPDEAKKPEDEKKDDKDKEQPKPAGEAAQKQDPNKLYDKSGDGMTSEAEFPSELRFAKRPELEKTPHSQNYATFNSLDRNKDGLLQHSEWEAFRTRIEPAPWAETNS